ncbi:MAG TPA: carboxypeptidase regulatory-like domain-containing protein [Terriglobales bacterium]|nr:carboxypeptidase regulatory-like domain-containing protein [Terriglobales bacterium]
MTKSRGFALAAWLMITLLLVSGAFAQESAVKGAISTVVTDAQGAVVTDAKVTITGPQGAKTFTTGPDGRVVAPLLQLGMYAVKVEKQGFKSAEVNNVEVLTGKTTALTVKMDIGSAGETVEVRADAVAVDTTSNAVSTNLNDNFYAAVPVGRNVGALFTAAPGVVSGGGTGSANPSIGGASGLENLYLADGVNITSAAFGGLGVYTQLYGSVGTGINLSFIKEVDVKTGGFEAQYGQANGGIVQIVTKSGSSQYHGALSLYGAPNWGRAQALYSDTTRVAQRGRLFDRQTYEASAELGGYVPGFKNHLFFFGAFDPNWAKDTFAPPASAGPTVRFNQNERTNTYNYAGKLTFKLNDSHSVEGSVFGDPAHTNTGRVLLKSLNVQNNTGWSKWEYGTRSVVARYNGTFSPTWLLNASYSHNNNDFTETPTQDVYQITDNTTSNPTILQGFGALLNHKSTTWAWNVDTTKVIHAAGSHSLMIGYRYERPEYIGDRIRSGPSYTVPALNATGGPWVPAGSQPSPIGQLANAQLSLRTAAASCTLCPLYPVAGVPTPVLLRVTRGEYNLGNGIQTHANYQAGYATDSWSINKYVTFTAGLRWEQQAMVGRDVRYTFTDNWSPRLGVTIDPIGDHKTKLFANYGRYSYPLPLDAALRQLSSELDLTNVDFAPVITGNTVSAVLDQAHLLNGAAGGSAKSATLASGGYPIVPGTRMNYEDEFVVGVEREFKGIVFSARYTDRRLKRIVEDIGSVSPENAVISQNSRIGNPSPKLDIFNNEKEVLIPAGLPYDDRKASAGGTGLFVGPNGKGWDPATQAFDVSGVSSAFAPCTVGVNTGAIPPDPTAGTFGVSGETDDANGNLITPSSICFLPATGVGQAGDVGADGLPDGFVSPIRNYTAFEFEANKAFSRGYLFRFNYRWAKLYGNYEGAFRNDNGQSDPGISSLFDFTTGNFNLLGDQFAPGLLNTDRRHVVNGFFSYTFSNNMLKGLTLGTGIRVQQGTPLNILGNHPNYGNAGEVPLGGRGNKGRTPVTGTVDLKLDYAHKLTERVTMHAGIDMFNLADARRVVNQDQQNALSFQPVGSNKDFGKPVSSFTQAFQDPFSSRFSLKFEF